MDYLEECDMIVWVNIWECQSLCLIIQIVDLDVGVVIQVETFITKEYKQLWRDLFMGGISLFYYLMGVGICKVVGGPQL